MSGWIKHWIKRAVRINHHRLETDTAAVWIDFSAKKDMPQRCREKPVGSFNPSASLHNAVFMYVDPKGERRCAWHRTFSDHPNDSRLNQGALECVLNAHLP